MKIHKVYKFLIFLSLMLILGFIIRLGADYFKNYKFGSAPFYVYVIERFVEFILPAIILFLVSKKMKNNMNKKYKEDN